MKPHQSILLFCEQISSVRSFLWTKLISPFFFFVNKPHQTVLLFLWTKLIRPFFFFCEQISSVCSFFLWTNLISPFFLFVNKPHQSVLFGEQISSVHSPFLWTNLISLFFFFCEQILAHCKLLHYSVFTNLHTSIIPPKCVLMSQNMLNIIWLLSVIQQAM